MDEVTVRCEIHGDIGAAPYAEDADHKVVGLAAGMAQAHRGAHPDCDVTFVRETAEEADRRRARESAQAEQEAQLARDMAERQRENMDRRHQLARLRARR